MKEASKDSFVLYRSFFDASEHLPDKDFKCFMFALKEYALDGVLPDFDGLLMALFVIAKPSIDAARNRYVAAVENGKKGGRPSKNKPPVEGESKPEQNQSNNQNDNQNKTRAKPNHNLTVTVTDTDTDTEAVTVTENVSESVTFSDTEDENGDGESEREGKEKPQNLVKLDKLLSRKDNSPSSASPQIEKIGKEKRKCPTCCGDLIHTAGGTAYCYDCQRTYETTENTAKGKQS
jgi:hypothetical protein